MLSPVIKGTFDLFQMDATEWLKTLESDSVDLISTDPAYESLERHRAIGKESIRRLKNWFPIFPNSRYLEFLTECYRVLRKNRHMYVICDAETMFVIKPLGEAVGFKFWKPIVWDKISMSTGYHYRNSCEFILFFEKGKRNLNSKGIRDVLQFRSIRRKESYPTEKPVALLEVLIKQSTQEGELVIDPFMGSGSCAEATVFQGRNFMGNDIEGRAHEFTRGRLLGRLL